MHTRFTIICLSQVLVFHIKDFSLSKFLYKSANNPINAVLPKIGSHSFPSEPLQPKICQLSAGVGVVSSAACPAPLAICLFLLSNSSALNIY